MDHRANLLSLLAAIPVPKPIAEGEELISVSSATRRIAFAYERFRNTLEPDEEDILRRKAIYRILDRRLDEDRPPLVTATALLQELIRAHYTQALPLSFAQHIAAFLQRTQALRTHLQPEIADWFLRIVAVTIDRELYPRLQEELLIQTMYQDVQSRTVWIDELVAPADRDSQLFIACHRALLASDDYEIAYHYFKFHFPAWTAETFTSEARATTLQQLPAFYSHLAKLVRHPARDRLARLVKPSAVSYRIIRDLIRERPQVLGEAPGDLEGATREALQSRMQKIRARMSTRIWHSILFLFLTKTLIGLIIELPYEIFFLGKPRWFALLVNVAFHPVLLFALATSARLPGQANADRVVEQVRKIVTGDGELPTVIMSKARTYGALTWSLFALVYAVLFMGIFWVLFSVLATLDFSLVAMGVFVVFLGLVSFLAMRIRRSVDALRVIPKKEGALSTLLSFLALPVLEFGRFLATHISQINVALFFMDSVLEAPFKLLIDITEEWFSFVRERREEIT